ncbi:MAG: hypothetical protein NTY61_00860, partial [Candidatus Parcubacteria bacterium]|nr:hypothetical protein [Candidatus Parcubacteria bacterium]
DIYIVETKLYKNPDKRTVVAQALDYGAALWKHLGDFGEFINRLDTEVQKKFKISFQQKIKEFFNLEEAEVDALLESMRRNLNEGNLKFVILMDEMDERLKDLIIYVNQNSQFDIFAVQLEYYKFEEYEIMIPKIFGVEVRKGAGITSEARPDWNKEKFLQAIKQNLEKSQTESMIKIYEQFEKIADRIRWGTGTLVGSYAPIMNKISPNRSLLSIFSNGKLSIKFSWFSNNDNEKELRDKFKDLLNQFAKGLKITENFRNIEVRFELKEWLPFADGILKSFEELKK